MKTAVCVFAAVAAIVFAPAAVADDSGAASTPGYVGTSESNLQPPGANTNPPHMRDQRDAFRGRVGAFFDRIFVYFGNGR